MSISASIELTTPPFILHPDEHGNGLQNLRTGTDLSCRSSKVAAMWQDGSLQRCTSFR
jgi:hypothetical protein